MSLNTSKLNQEQYFERINFKGKLNRTLACLKQIHKCHVMAVPFEVLDIRFKKEIILDKGSLFDKIVLCRRGGYCYELNYLFHSLLSQVGFDCDLISCRVFDQSKFGPEYDHLAILVKLGVEGEWLVDVGFGDSFIEPIRIESELIQKDRFKDYKISETDKGDYTLMESLKDKNEFLNKYMFSLQPRKIEEFYDQNDFKQNSPDSHFVKNTICTLPTAMGRKTIKNKIFRVRNGPMITEKEINGDEDLLKLLQREFNIEIDKNEQLK